VTDFLAAVSVGIVDGVEMLDLCYMEDSNAATDMNVVMTSKGEFIEIQATGEQLPFKKEQFDKLLSFAEKGISQLIEIQKDALGQVASEVGELRKMRNL